MVNIPIINPLHWGYHGTVEQAVSPNGTVNLKLKDSKAGSSNKGSQLHEFIGEQVPELSNNARFELNPYLFTGILQTMYLGSADFSKSFPVFYGREIVNYSDGGISTADWVMAGWKQKYDFAENDAKFNLEQFKKDEESTHPENWPRLHPRTRFLNDEELKGVHAETKPLIVVLHGLAGGSHEPIIRSLTKNLSEISNGKFDVVVLNTRGCARSKITTRKLFYAYATDDIREFLKREKERHPGRRIFTVGYSFGGTILGNYLGEDGENAPVDAAAILCCPWDLYTASLKMRDDWWSRKLFSKNIAQFLTRLVKVNMGELEYTQGKDEPPAYPASIEHPSYTVFTRENLKKAYSFNSTVEFDDVYTAPCLGYQNALEYYKAGGSINRLPNIKVPTLIINSKDDPVVGEEAIPVVPAKENVNVTLCITDIGGHLAYLDKKYNSWAGAQIAQFFNKFEELVQ